MQRWEAEWMIGRVSFRDDYKAFHIGATPEECYVPVVCKVETVGGHAVESRPCKTTQEAEQSAYAEYDKMMFNCSFAGGI